MKASNIAFFVVVFVLGITAGVVINQLNGPSVQPMASVDQRDLASTSPALIARFDQMEARLGDLAAALNRFDDPIIKGAGTPDNERPLSANSPKGREKYANDPVAESAVNTSKFEEIKNRVFDSLQDTATNFTTLLQSKEMQSISKEQRDDVMREVAARLDSGQLSKEQFLPGYKAQPGSK